MSWGTGCVAIAGQWGLLDKTVRSEPPLDELCTLRTPTSRFFHIRLETHSSIVSPTHWFPPTMMNEQH